MERPWASGFGGRLLSKYRRAGWSVIDQSIVSAANFLSILLLARFLPPAQFGVFVLAHTGLLLLTSLQTSLVTQPHNILGAKLAAQEYRRFTGALLAVQLAAGVLVCLILALAGVVMRRYFSAEAGGALLALSLAAPPWMAQEFVRRVLYTRSESRSAAVNDLLSYGLQLLGVGLLVRHGGPELLKASSALLIFGASSLAALLLGLWQLRGHLGFEARAFGQRLRAVWAQVWEFGRWLLAQNVVTWMGANGHAWVVGALLGAESVGLYRAAIHLVNIINPLRQAAFAYLPARASVAFQASGHAGLAHWVKHVSTRLFLPLAPVAVVLIVLPEQVLGLVYGGKFAGLGLGAILALATVAQIIAFLKFPMEVAVMSMGSPRSLFLVNLLPVALLMTAGVALIVALGIWGVPLSSILISSVLFLSTWLVYRRLVNPALPAAA